ncbi:MAG TPA: ribosome silencing factor [Candidatus Limnocylindrales bacterium]
MTDPATPLPEPIPIASVRKRASARGRAVGSVANATADAASQGGSIDEATTTPSKRRVATRAEVVAAARAERPPLEVARRAVDVAEDKKAADIVLLDLAGITTLADYFIICSGGSERQIQAIADGIVEALRAEGVRPIGREGEAASHWILVDFGSVIVHVFTPPERDYYELEKHWAEARTILRVQ